MDLPKAFDNINHDLLIAKLGAYGFDTGSLKLIRSYLTIVSKEQKWIKVSVVGQNCF